MFSQASVDISDLRLKSHAVLDVCLDRWYCGSEDWSDFQNENPVD
jgi:hypothetical protein